MGDRIVPDYGRRIDTFSQSSGYRVAWLITVSHVAQLCGYLNATGIFVKVYNYLYGKNNSGTLLAAVILGVITRGGM